MTDIREVIAQVLREHATTFVDQDGDTRCDCGKWLEPGEHEWDWHVSGLIGEALNLTEEWAHMGKSHPDDEPELDEWSCGHQIITPTRYGPVHDGFDTPVRRLIGPWTQAAEGISL